VSLAKRGQAVNVALIIPSATPSTDLPESMAHYWGPAAKKCSPFCAGTEHLRQGPCAMIVHHHDLKIEIDDLQWAEGGYRRKNEIDWAASNRSV